MSFHWEWSRDPQRSEVTVTGPDDEATTAFFARVREFDTPGKMVYVPKYIDHLEATATGPLVEILKHARAAHGDVGRVAHRWERIVLGDAARPRDVWELWTYGYV